MAPHGSPAPGDPGVLEPKHKVFLSHSGVQKEFVRQLVVDLESWDIHPFFDEDRDSLPIGEKFPELKSAKLGEKFPELKSAKLGEKFPELKSAKLGEKLVDVVSQPASDEFENSFFDRAMDSRNAWRHIRFSVLGSHAVARLEFCMNTMLTEGELSLTTGAWLKSKLKVEVRLVLEQWAQDIWKGLSFSDHWLCKLKFLFVGGAKSIYFRGIAASLSEYIGSFLDMFPPPTVEEDLLRTKRDEEARLLSAVADLALLYLYLVGLIDRGGTRTYSSGSLLFSSTFVSIVLVLAFYVWFKSRAAPRRGYHRKSPSGRITIEARYKPPGASGNFYLGVCADDEEAGIKQEIAAYFYDQYSRSLAIKDREERFEIPLTPSVPANLDAVGKRRWVKTRVMEVYEEFKSFAASLPSLPVAFDPDVRLEDMDQDLFDHPEAMFDSLAVETQHVPEAVPIMFPAPGGHHSEVAVGGGAAQVIPQSNSCEVPPTLSASRASPGTDVVFFQQLSAPLAGPSNMDQPQNTTLDLSQAWEALSLYKQINEEKDRLLVEQNRIIDWLKLENERLRSISNY